MIDTFTFFDTGNVITHKSDFCVVSLRQGSDDGKQCTVILETWSKEDINLMLDEEGSGQGSEAE